MSHYEIGYSEGVLGVITEAERNGEYNVGYQSGEKAYSNEGRSGFREIYKSESYLPEVYLRRYQWDYLID